MVFLISADYGGYAMIDRIMFDVNQLPGNALLCNAHGTVLATNQMFRDLTGYHLGSGEQVALNDIIHPLDNSLISNFFTSLEAASRADVALRIKGLKADDIHVVLQGVIHTIDRNTLIVIQVFDMTQCVKRLESQLEQERFLNSIINSMPGLVYRCKNDKNWTMEYLSGHCLELTGYNEEDLISNTRISFNDLIHPDYQDQVWQSWQTVLNQKGVFMYEYPILTANGKEKWVWEQGVGVYDLNGDILGVEGIVIDISERKQVEKALIKSKQQLKKQNDEYVELNEELRISNAKIKQMNADLLATQEKAEQSEKLKSAFLANMSHEIRTPMNGILGFSQLLASPHLSEGERVEFVRIIQNSGNQLLAIINDLIDISKIEANIITIHPEPHNLNELLNELFLLFKPLADEAEISLSFSAGLSNAQSSIGVDATRLRQILSNLLSNSLKFTRQGHIKFGYVLKGKKLEFYVEDTGVGIPTDMHGLIFERFRQVDSSFERQASGTGLGLAISKALVNKMSGEIWVQSEAYFGSTFFFSLPYIKSIPEVVEQDYKVDTHEIDNSFNLNVLIAEDNEVNYIYLKELLSEIKPNIIWVTNGRDAVDRVSSDPTIDIVLMDVKMPLMDGYQATREIKKIRANLPVIAQTAYSFASDRQNALEAGCDDYISKPIDKDQFLDLLFKYIKVK